MALHKLVFDTTDATTRAASANVGAYIRSDDGTLITHVTEGANERLHVDATMRGTNGDAITVTGGALDVNLASGSITINETDIYAEDSAHTTADDGSFVLSVRVDDLTAIPATALAGTELDYQAFITGPNGELFVGGNQFDIDDLNATDDAVAAWAHDGTGTAITSTGGALDVNLASGTIDFTYDYAEDSAAAGGETGAYVLTVRQDTLATDTSADGDFASFKVNASGELYTTDEGAEALLTTIDADTGAILSDTNAMVVDLAAIEVELLDQGTVLDTMSTNIATIAGDTTSMDATLTGLSHAEDAAHVSGDAGFQALAVRNDTLATLADTDGDYAPLQVDASGALYVTIASGDNDDSLANTAIANAVNTMTVADTAEDVVASPLASRKYLFIYNNNNKEVFVGASGVSAANGFPLPPGSILEMRAGAAVDIEWVAADTAQEIRTLELS